jgi:hypothetical protein
LGSKAAAENHVFVANVALAQDDLGKGGGGLGGDARLVVEIVHSTSPAPAAARVLALLAEQKNRY